jgi:hypothetical protein
MPKIIGEPIPDYVAYQINKRQDVHGKINRDANDLSYLNSKTAWIKLASGISLNNDRVTKENLRGGVGAFPSDTLAQRHILFGGVARKDGNELIQRGTNLNGKNGIYDTYTGMYNVNADAEDSKYGLAPMPGIISADIQCQNRGSIKKATLKIKCYTPEQFHILDLLYLRIGYTMLLEWGYSKYLNNSGGLENMGYTLTEAADGFFAQTDYYQMLPRIEGYRSAKAGNYDGLISKVVNFSWSFAHDGSYDITLELISVGDVVESLKCNVVPPYETIKFIKEQYVAYVNSEGSSTEEDSQQDNPVNNVISAHLFMQKVYLKLSLAGIGNEALTTQRDVTLTYSGGQIELGATKVYPVVNNALVRGPHTNIVYFSYNNADLSDLGFYMRLGYLLEFIKSDVIPKNKDTDQPIINIDTHTGGDASDGLTNRMYAMPYQVSLDPRVCIVNGRELVNTKNFYKELDAWKIDGDEYAARTMNIYVNHSTINRLVSSNVDDRGNFNLYEFLKSLCDELNKALGGINRLEPVVDEDNHIITIIDQTFTPKVSPGSKYGLELYGYNPSFNSSNFIRNMSLKTEISSDFATMATIGSTAGGYVKGTENTMFSKWNKGIVDRYKEQYTVKDKNPDEMLEDVRKVYLEEFWKQRSSAFGMKIDEDNVTLDDNIIENNITNGTEFFKAVYAKMQRTNPNYASPSAGFVPISLGVTMDGLAGFKIYNSLNVSTRFLPENYGDNLHFIVKGVNHKLSNSDWETTLETVVIANSNQ